MTPNDYAYLNQSGCVDLEGVDDAERFDRLRLALEIVQVNKVRAVLPGIRQTNKDELIFFT